MMLKVTLKFSVNCVIVLLFGCSGGKREPDIQENVHYADSVSEARIDVAYESVTRACDSLMTVRVPQMADALRKDPAFQISFFDTAHLYTDSNEKVEKVIRQLQADCEANLLKETYKRARLRLKLKPLRHIKPKT